METKEVIAKIHSHGKEFEIIVDAEKVHLYKEGKLSNLDELLISNSVFRGIRTTKKIDDLPMKPGGGGGGQVEKVSDTELQEAFGTTDFLQIAKKILDDGEIQLTTEQRNEILDKKKKQIVTFISQQAIDPRTNNPHPPQRIENAIDQAKVKIDLFKPIDSQVKDIISEIRPILPISIEKKKILLKIPVQFAGKCKYLVSKFSTVEKEVWSGQHWMVEIEIPAGLQEKLFSSLNSVTHGDVESKVIE